jgi:transportin-1
MPPLIDKWNSIDNTDRKLFPLLECLSSLAGAMGMGFKQFAQPVWQRCLAIIENTYMAAKVARETGDEPPEKDFITCSLDLIGGIVEGLGSSVEGLVANTNILRLLYQCMQDDSSEVRQSAFGVLGDLARTCIGHLKDVLRDYLAILIQNLSASSYAVSNNACWAIGEISMQVGKAIKPYVESIMAKLVHIINSQNVSISLMENAAITIGRLGLICPEVIAPHLETFSKNWCLTLCSIKHEVEKEQAFKGLCALIKANPKGVFKSFAYVCDAIVSFKRPPQNLQYEFAQILHGFKNSYGDKWNQYFATFPSQLRQKLQEGYKL